MKIKKNLSDAEMLKGFKEESSFENSVYQKDEQNSGVNKNLKNKDSLPKEVFLPAEIVDKLNRYLLELSMEWLKNGNGNAEWKVYKEKEQIVIKPAPVKKKDK
ncbi:MAG TPA: hypothetical protein IAB06_08125 [Candidatus Avacidaminococcus intestinavium]|uniref:Uncharacterized protein n=1 Tax=Candidatus Avacidaminococcus intestinavium TaxID=2840684 RepID=A0A9D1MRJ9_9FIRM|nr:hypothetical protein [Candidatus Avacidaminococcus intestinavium]